MPEVTKSISPRHLEQVLREVKHLSAHDIFEAIKKSALDFAPPCDDISVVVIKRN